MRPARLHLSFLRLSFVCAHQRRDGSASHGSLIPSRVDLAPRQMRFRHSQGGVRSHLASAPAPHAAIANHSTYGRRGVRSDGRSEWAWTLRRVEAAADTNLARGHACGGGPLVCHGRGRTFHCGKIPRYRGEHVVVACRVSPIRTHTHPRHGSPPAPAGGEYEGASYWLRPVGSSKK